MANLKKISLLWEDKRITLLEVDKSQPVLTHTIDLSPVYAEAAFGASLSEEIQIVALLQKTLRELRIESAEVYMGIANREMILRSFVLPVLKPHEIQTAVQFEAKKYIPFDINELKFVYHALPIVDNKIKRLRIIFYGVRKEIIDKHERIIRQTGLSLISCEPAAVGLCRGMMLQKDITPELQVAVLELNQHNGRIYFIDRGIVLFIRDFQLNSSMGTQDIINDQETVDPDVMKNKIFNEIRNSIEFFTRQYHEQVSQLLVYGEDEIVDLVSGLAVDLNVTVRRYSANIVSTVNSFKGIDIVSCFGLLNASATSPVALLDLLAKPKIKKERKFSNINVVTFNFYDFKPAIQLALFLGVICGGVFGYIHYQKQELNKEIAALVASQGEFQPQTTEELQTKITKFATDTTAFKNVRFNSDLHIAILLISKSLSENMWLDGLDVRSSGEEIKTVGISFRGNVYVKDVNLQIKAVNDFISKMRLDKNLAKYFTKITLQSIQRQEDNGVTFTTFSVTCN